MMSPQERPALATRSIAAVLEQSKVTHVCCEKALVGLLGEARAHPAPAAIVDLPTGAARARRAPCAG